MLSTLGSISRREIECSGRSNTNGSNGISRIGGSQLMAVSAHSEYKCNTRSQPRHPPWSQEGQNYECLHWEAFSRPNRSSGKSASPLGLRLIRFFGWPFRKEAVGIIRFFPLAVVRIPYVRETDNAARQGDCSKSLHRVAHNPALEFWLMWLAGLMAKRKIEEYCTWRVDCFSNVKRRRHAESGNSGCFNHSRDQSYGLMAHGSGRYQIKCINLRPLEFLDNFRGKFVAHLARRVDSTH